MVRAYRNDSRRTFLKAAGIAVIGSAIAPAFVRANASMAVRMADASDTGATKDAIPSGPADVTLRIGPVMVDVAKNRTISTTGYNGSSPGPLIRLEEGKTVTAPPSGNDRVSSRWMRLGGVAEASSEIFGQNCVGSRSAPRAISRRPGWQSSRMNGCPPASSDFPRARLLLRRPRQSQAHHRSWRGSRS
jgi:hypothetical protein